MAGKQEKVMVQVTMWMTVVGAEVVQAGIETLRAWTPNVPGSNDEQMVAASHMLKALRPLERE